MVMNLAGKGVERFFAALARFIITYRIVVLIIVFGVVGALGVQIRHLRFDTSNEGFLRENDPILSVYNDFRDQFGRDDMLVLAIESDHIFTANFLYTLAKLHDDLAEQVPYVNDITSLINVRNTRGEGDVLLVDDLLAELPENEAGFTALAEQVLANPLYLNQLVSEDGRFTTLLIESDVYAGAAGVSDTADLLAGFDEIAASAPAKQTYLSDVQNDAFVEAVHAVTARYQNDDFIIHTAGPPVNLHAIKFYMQQDAKRFMKLALLIIGVCLYIMFRRFSGVALPLLVVGLALIATVGLMAGLGVAFKLPTTILPSFLLAVGVGGSVHVLSLTFQYMRGGEPKNQAVIAAFGHSGLAIVMTSLTTATGLASFAFAKVAPIADLGMFSAIGVLISLILTLTILPCLLSLLPIDKGSQQAGAAHGAVDRLLESIADFSVRRYRMVLVVAALLAVVGAAGIVRVKFSHDALVWLPEDLGIRQATEVIDRELKGSVVLEVLVDTGIENGLYNPEIVQAIDTISKELEADYRGGTVFIGKSMSLTTIVKEIHQALHGNDPAFYTIADNERLIAQELLLFENSGSDDLKDVVDSRFRVARVTLKVPWQDALLYVPFIDDVNKRFTAAFDGRAEPGGEPMTVRVTGIMSLFGRIIHAAMYSAAQSYGIALVVITVLMIVLIGNFKLGFISMIPNLIPIFTVLGMMGWLGVRLDMFTMLIASIAIGIAVDDTIHFFYNFRKYFAQSGEVRSAVHRTLQTAGRAMLTTSVVLAIGFFIFMFAAMKNLFYFGLLTGTAIILALAADLCLAPALMALAVGGKPRLNTSS
jgi:predicted RND superfamily exporter protein